MPISPYKFLQHYGLDDRDIFFGREKETEILVSDIVLGRLVVLFARTGTGKTSLINAGVRPRLLERDYETSFVRVREDPVKSARLELTSQFDHRLVGDTFAAQLENLSNRLDNPLVIFFDQFEEFFIYVGGDSETGRQFISDIGRLYKNKQSEVHIVFSMREEFLHEMDHFREEVPTIFHKDSALRLRGFDEEQARDAIKLPAGHFDCEIEDALISRLIKDLFECNTGRHTGAEIEPTQLQIVCDTLWQARTGNKITLDDYFDLGGGDKQNIAQRILDGRLEKEFEKIQQDEQLKLLERILPKLCTEQNTKKIRDLDGLVEELGTSKSELESLVDRLETSRLIQKTGRGDSMLIEFSHDYLADTGRIKYLQDRVRKIWLRRIRNRRQFVSPDDLAEILENKREWRLDKEQLSFLFRSSLAHGLDMRRWFDLASEGGVGVWDLLGEKIDSKNMAEALNALDLVREVQDVKAIALLERALRRAELNEVAKPTLEVVAQSRDPEIARAAKTALTSFADSVKTGPPLERERQPTYDNEPEWRPSGGASSGAFGTLEPAYAAIADLLSKGRVIPFLGPGASLSWRQRGATWNSGSDYLPTADELARYLAARVNFPGRETFDLPKVAQYYSVLAGRAPLYNDLHKVFSRNYEPTGLHHFLAGISVPLLIVTTNYDDLIERAYQLSNQPFHLIIHTVEQTSGDTILWQRHDQSKPVEISPRDLDIELDNVTVIYKMRGSVSHSDPWQEHYVITEDDYADFVSRMSRGRAIPAIFAEPFQTRHFLFIGYTLGDWSSRIFLNRFEKDLRRPKRIVSWAIQRQPSALEARLWRDRGVEIYDMDIEDFIRHL